MSYNMHSGYGLMEMIRMHCQLPVMGKLLIVAPTDDPNYNRLYQMVKEDKTGDGTTIRLYNTVAAAYAAATTNAHDVIALSANSSHSITTMITVAKNRVHFIGLDGGGRQTGHGARLVMGVTTAATDLAVLKNTGVRNSFRNIKFESSNTKAESLYALIEAGEYACYENCSVLKLTDLDQATAADVVAEGDGTTWRNCEFGAATLLATAARPTMLIDKIVGSTGMLDNNFFDCNFVSYTSAIAKVFVKVAAAGDGQRYAMFRGCSFLNWDIASGGSAMTNAISAPAGSELYIVLDAKCTVVGCGKVATVTTPGNVGVYTCGVVPVTTTSGIAVNAAAA